MKSYYTTHHTILIHKHEPVSKVKTNKLYSTLYYTTLALLFTKILYHKCATIGQNVIFPVVPEQMSHYTRSNYTILYYYTVFQRKYSPVDKNLHDFSASECI